jgi:CBS domain-containing protein
MPIVSARNILKGLLVEEAMRRQVIKVPQEASLDRCINHLIKFKVNALLIVDPDRCPHGVVSKTDIAGAFYAGLSMMEIRAADIMNGPPITCFPDDELGEALDLMDKRGVHQLFVQGAEPCATIGVLSNPDVVALLYRFCRACPKGAFRSVKGAEAFDRTQLFSVRDAMKPKVIFCRHDDSLAAVIEQLAAHRLSAVLVKDAAGLPAGIISKTDIVLAYHHGMTVQVQAASIMNSPIVSCDENSLLSDAIRSMFLKDVQRVFVYSGAPENIVGVLSLSDAAQMRSGSCRACVASRIIGKKEG